MMFLKRVPRGRGRSFALETIGWKAFQDLCSQICEEVLRRPVQIYREAQDGGQDAVFTVEGPNGAVDATVQCKHSSDPRRRLRGGDLNEEFDTVAELVAANQADTYFLITSMGVDAAVAVDIRAKLRALGVRKPHVLGREYLVRAIRASARLRALVPQVYGLGDLGAILDQRLISADPSLARPLDSEAQALRPNICAQEGRSRADGTRDRPPARQSINRQINNRRDPFDHRERRRRSHRPTPHQPA